MTSLRPINMRGMLLYPGLISPETQELLLARLRDVVAQAPLFSPVTPSGRKMSVRMTSAGRFGWVSDRSGYRYSGTHPDGQSWPDIPKEILDIWDCVVPESRDPECCLINFYDGDAKMGLHQDRDEVDFDQPVVSVSLGDDALFRVGNLERGGKTESVWLTSGDVIVMRGQSRLLHHGVDRIKTGSSRLLSKGGRINLTLRVVT